MNIYIFINIFINISFVLVCYIVCCAHEDKRVYHHRLVVHNMNLPHTMTHLFLLPQEQCHEVRVKPINTFILVQHTHSQTHKHTHKHTLKHTYTHMFININHTKR